MHAYLIVGKNKDLIGDKAREISEKHNAVLEPFDLQKISDVRELQAATKLSVQEPTAFFISNIDNATNDALNAFLKQLEEPGKNIYFILSARSEDSVLQTISSRCQIIRVKEVSKTKALNGVLFFNQSIGEQFAVVDKVKKRDEAVMFLQNMMEEMHQNLLLSPSNSISKASTEAQQTLTALEKNGNVTIQLARMIVAFANFHLH